MRHLSMHQVEETAIKHVIFQFIAHLIFTIETYFYKCNDGMALGCVKNEHKLNVK